MQSPVESFMCSADIDYVSACRCDIDMANPELQLMYPINDIALVECFTEYFLPLQMDKTCLR